MAKKFSRQGREGGGEGSRVVLKSRKGIETQGSFGGKNKA